MSELLKVAWVGKDKEWSEYLGVVKLGEHAYYVGRFDDIECTCGDLARANFESIDEAYEFFNVYVDERKGKVITEKKASK